MTNIFSDCSTILDRQASTLNWADCSQNIPQNRNYCQNRIFRVPDNWPIRTSNLWMDRSKGLMMGNVPTKVQIHLNKTAIDNGCFRRACVCSKILPSGVFCLCRMMAGNGLWNVCCLFLVVVGDFVLWALIQA